MPWPLAGTGDDRDHAPHGARKAGLVEQGVDFLLRPLRIALASRGAKDNNPELRRGQPVHLQSKEASPAPPPRAPKSRNRRRRGERACPFHRIQPIHSTARPAPGNESSGAFGYDSIGASSPPTLTPADFGPRPQTGRKAGSPAAADIPPVRVLSRRDPQLADRRRDRPSGLPLSRRSASAPRSNSG